MFDCVEFGDYLEAGVHEAVRENTFAIEWARTKVRVTKSLRQDQGTCHQVPQTFGR